MLAAVGTAAKNVPLLLLQTLACHPGLVPGAPYTELIAEHLYK